MSAAEEVLWEEPPKKNAGGGWHNGKWIPLLEPIMATPGRWARIADGPVKGLYAKATHLRKRDARVPEGRWEFTVRTIDKEKKTGRLYARYLGGDPE